MKDKIFLALLQTSGAHWEHARKGFQELGLSDGQPKVLYILRRSEGCVQKKLAQLCQIRESTMTVLLTKMEEKGYIRKETLRVSGGKRAYGIYLTDRGRELSDRLVELIDRLEELSFQGFSKEEKEQLFSLLDRVKANLMKA